MSMVESADEWQPIETAPKDGTRVLGYWSYLYPGDKEVTRWIEVIEWYDDGKISGWHGEEGVAADGVHSHWRPLPAMPTLDAALKEDP